MPFGDQFTPRFGIIRTLQTGSFPARSRTMGINKCLHGLNIVIDANGSLFTPQKDVITTGDIAEPFIIAISGTSKIYVPTNRYVAGYGIYVGKRPANNFSISFNDYTSGLDVYATEDFMCLVGSLAYLKMVKRFLLHEGNCKIKLTIIKITSHVIANHLNKSIYEWNENNWENVPEASINFINYYKQCFDIIEFLFKTFGTKVDFMFCSNRQIERRGDRIEVAHALAHTACDRVLVNLR